MRDDVELPMSLVEVRDGYFSAGKDIGCHYCYRIVLRAMLGSLSRRSLRIRCSNVRLNSSLVSPLVQNQELLQGPDAFKVPQFVVGKENGFLPREDPMTVLPPEYAPLESLLQRMPIKTASGGVGLLRTGDFGRCLMEELPDYTEQVSKIEDSKLLAALFRDYTFATSAYLLEPCDIEYRKSQTYGLGRQVLPRKLAVPLSIIAKKIGARPFMEYALSYALYNYARVDPSKPLDYPNLRLIRTFDGSDAEHGFILVHVAMVRYSGDLVRYAQQVLDGCKSKNRKEFDAALNGLLNTSIAINQTMESMWTRSSSAGYNEFRSFIMGTKNQPMFPNGVVYEGVSEEGTQYRGESGANDSMIPTLDNLLQVTENMPPNPLTAILNDFRAYRPGNHNDWLRYVDQTAKECGVMKYAMENADSSVFYLANLDMVREFRMRHWNFTKEYIIKYSKHAVGTGGSPISTWLPNQLSTVMTLITDLGNKVDKTQITSQATKDMFDRIMTVAEAQNRILKREVEKLKVEYNQ